MRNAFLIDEINLKTKNLALLKIGQKKQKPSERRIEEIQLKLFDAKMPKENKKKLRNRRTGETVPIVCDWWR